MGNKISVYPKHFQSHFLAATMQHANQFATHNPPSMSHGTLSCYTVCKGHITVPKSEIKHYIYPAGKVDTRF